MGGLYGGDREESADTSWTVHYLDDDWSNAPEWTTLREDNPWLQRMRALLQRAAAGRSRAAISCARPTSAPAATR